MTPSNLAGRIAFQFYQRFLVIQLGGLIFFKHVICNRQIITCYESDVVLIHSFLYHTANSLEDSIVRDMVLKTRE